MGWPSATAPPFTLVLAGSRPNCSHHGDGLDGEGFVQFEQVHVLGFPVELLEQHAHGVHGRHHHPLGLDAAHGLPHDARQGRLPQFAGLFERRHHQRRRAVIRAGSVAGGHRAIRLEGGPQLGERFQRSVRARGFVGRKLNGIAFLLLDGDGHNLVLKRPFLMASMARRWLSTA